QSVEPNPKGDTIAFVVRRYVGINAAIYPHAGVFDVVVVGIVLTLIECPVRVGKHRLRRPSGLLARTGDEEMDADIRSVGIGLKFAVGEGTGSVRCRGEVRIGIAAGLVDVDGDRLAR